MVWGIHTLVLVRFQLTFAYPDEILAVARIQTRIDEKSKKGSEDFTS
jgi:hypothetical protein